MKKYLLLLFLFFLAVLPVGAQDASLTPTPSIVEYNLPYPGILPDHPLYTLKKVRDNILFFFTRSVYKKSNLLLLFADKKLVMGRQLWEKRNYDLSLKTLDEGERDLLKGIAGLAKDRNNLPIGTKEKYFEAGKKHSEVINQLFSTADQPINLKLKEILSITNEAMQKVNSL